MESGVAGGRVPSPQHLPCTSPSPSRPHLPFLPARDGGCSPGSPGSSPAEGSGCTQGRSDSAFGEVAAGGGALPPNTPLPRTWAFSIRSPGPWPLVPSELCPLPALRILPTLPSLPTLFLSPAGKAGAKGLESQLALPTADGQSDAHPGARLPSRRMYLGCLG